LTAERRLTASQSIRSSVREKKVGKKNEVFSVGSVLFVLLLFEKAENRVADLGCQPAVFVFGAGDEV
jgi:hypothetical protein